MSNAIPKIPAAPPPAPARVTPPASPPASTLPGGERRHAIALATTSPPALSSSDVSYVNSLMGVLPAQKMEEILLKTGIPIPAHLGPNVDVTA